MINVFFLLDVVSPPKMFSLTSQSPPLLRYFCYILSCTHLTLYHSVGPGCDTCVHGQDMDYLLLITRE